MSHNPEICFVIVVVAVVVCVVVFVATILGLVVIIVFFGTRNLILEFSQIRSVIAEILL